MTSAEFARILDDWTMRGWAEAAGAIDRTAHKGGRLSALSHARALVLAGRERGRLEAIEFIRAAGGSVPNDFGLPCNVLQVPPSRTH